MFSSIMSMFASSGGSGSSGGGGPGSGNSTSSSAGGGDLTTGTGDVFYTGSTAATGIHPGWLVAAGVLVVIVLLRKK
jgi:hypothetical protein